MPNLRVRPNERDESGAVLEVTPESAGWTYVGFRVIALEAVQTNSRRSAFAKVSRSST